MIRILFFGNMRLSHSPFCSPNFWHGSWDTWSFPAGRSRSSRPICRNTVPIVWPPPKRSGCMCRCSCRCRRMACCGSVLLKHEKSKKNCVNVAISMLNERRHSFAATYLQALYVFFVSNVSIVLACWKSRRERKNEFPCTRSTVVVRALSFKKQRCHVMRQKVKKWRGSWKF